jgi:hypothetical protein
MTLDAQLLEKLADWRPAARQTLEINDPAAGWTVAVEADAADLVGVRVWEARLAYTGATPPGDLADRAHRTASAVTGLLEPLRLVEVDAVGGVALLRSDEPTQRGSALHYYEVLLNGSGAASLRRFQGPDADHARRRQISFALTHESLAKWVADVTSSL